MHKLLLRQLKKHFPDATQQQQLAAFLSAVDNAYKQNDDDRILLERSNELTSVELSERNRLLQRKLKQLETIHAQLESSVATLQATFDSVREAVFAFDISSLQVQCNRLGKEILSLPLDKDIHSLRSCLNLLKKHLLNPEDLRLVLEKSNEPNAKEVFYTLTFKNGKVYEVHNAKRVRNNKLSGSVWCLRDITDYQETQSKIQHQAYHDTLTKLPNRLLLTERLSQSMTVAREKNELIAILFIDLDHFKKVNDSSGHNVGDELLICVSKRISSCIRGKDILARLGGDEFVILVDGFKSTNIVTDLSSRVISSIRTPFIIAGNDFHIGCSIGISIFPRDGETVEELLRKSDMSMYRAKNAGRNNFQYFDESLERFAIHRLQLENKLRAAISSDELVVYFQPKIELKNQNIKSSEALLRWISNGTHISPAEFIPIAEQTGLIHEISRRVLRNVCQQLRWWADHGYNPQPVAVNISSMNFNDLQFMDFVSETLQTFNIPGQWLDFELTETVLLHSTIETKSFIDTVKDLGITLTIDDFGTGYSSLSYLHKLPIDQIKIDKSFILDLIENKQNQTIVKTILGLANSLGIKVVAEGVESKSIHEWLAKYCCDFAQGYYYHRPMPVSKFSRLIAPQNND